MTPIKTTREGAHYGTTGDGLGPCPISDDYLTCGMEVCKYDYAEPSAAVHRFLRRQRDVNLLLLFDVAPGATNSARCELVARSAGMTVRTVYRALARREV